MSLARISSYFVVPFSICVFANSVCAGDSFKSQSVIGYDKFEDPNNKLTLSAWSYDYISYASRVKSKGLPVKEAAFLKRVGYASFVVSRLDMEYQSQSSQADYANDGTGYTFTYLHRARHKSMTLSASIGKTKVDHGVGGNTLNLLNNEKTYSIGGYSSPRVHYSLISIDSLLEINENSSLNFVRKRDSYRFKIKNVAATEGLSSINFEAFYEKGDERLGLSIVESEFTSYKVLAEYFADTHSSIGLSYLSSSNKTHNSNNFKTTALTTSKYLDQNTSIEMEYIRTEPESGTDKTKTIQIKYRKSVK